MEFFAEIWSVLAQCIDVLLHLDKYLDQVITTYGTWTYLILFLIIFLETGLVVTPILPGDSLLFAAGAFAARGSLDIAFLFGLLSVAAILGDAVNYSIGFFLGPKVLRAESRFLKREYLEKTQNFYEKYGGKTIVIARFVPIVRTFAPFLAGIGKMRYPQFLAYNIVGALLWMAICLFGGYFFGNLEIVRKNFTLVILGVIFVSILPALFEIISARRHSPMRSL
jgi:membrane-associated protein